MIEYLKTRPKELRGLKPDIASRAKDYVYNKFEFYVIEDCIYARLSGSYVKGIWFKIENYNKYTALELIRDTDLGRHFEDGIYKIWKEKDLDFGFVGGNKHGMGRGKVYKQRGKGED